MKIFTIFLMLLALPILAEEPPERADVAPDEAGEARFMTRIRQLTFEGRRSGEAYFSSKGHKLVFQSERYPGNPFFQIYELDLETGDSRLISPGPGKTTCAYYRPGSGDIQYASTHHDPRSEEYQRQELEARAAGEQKRYAWDYDPEMDIYVQPSAGEPRRLTDARGYDAEGSYSPDGKWIVFTSTRDAFNRKLSDSEAKQLEMDPSYFAEIYLMRADGSDPRRLTETPGYDGGPFFSVDGERIIWRRFETDGVIADVWSMKTDGSDPRQITDFGAMSWAPYPHPSGEYLFFTANKLGFGNFELFIVDSAGLHEPVRVSYTDGFDGLPVPSPDGNLLVWTSKRGGGESQIYIAAWNHEQALAALASSPKREQP